MLVPIPVILSLLLISLSTANYIQCEPKYKYSCTVSVDDAIVSYPPFVPHHFYAAQESMVYSYGEGVYYTTHIDNFNSQEYIIRPYYTERFEFGGQVHRDVSGNGYLYGNCVYYYNGTNMHCFDTHPWSKIYDVKINLSGEFLVVGEIGGNVVFMDGISQTILIDYGVDAYIDTWSGYIVYVDNDIIYYYQYGTGTNETMGELGDLTDLILAQNGYMVFSDIYGKLVVLPYGSFNPLELDYGSVFVKDNLICIQRLKVRECFDTATGDLLTSNAVGRLVADPTYFIQTHKDKFVLDAGLYINTTTIEVLFDETLNATLVGTSSKGNYLIEQTVNSIKLRNTDGSIYNDQPFPRRDVSFYDENEDTYYFISELAMTYSNITGPPVSYFARNLRSSGFYIVRDNQLVGTVFLPYMKISERVVNGTDFKTISKKALCNQTLGEYQLNHYIYDRFGDIFVGASNRNDILLFNTSECSEFMNIKAPEENIKAISVGRNRMVYNYNGTYYYGDLNDFSEVSLLQIGLNNTYPAIYYQEQQNRFILLEYGGDFKLLNDNNTTLETKPTGLQNIEFPAFITGSNDYIYLVYGFTVHRYSTSLSVIDNNDISEIIQRATINKVLAISNLLYIFTDLFVYIVDYTDHSFSTIRFPLQVDSVHTKILFREGDDNVFHYSRSDTERIYLVNTNTQESVVIPVTNPRVFKNKDTQDLLLASGEMLYRINGLQTEIIYSGNRTSKGLSAPLVYTDLQKDVSSMIYTTETFIDSTTETTIYCQAQCDIINLQCTCNTTTTEDIIYYDDIVLDFGFTSDGINIQTNCKSSLIVNGVTLTNTIVTIGNEFVLNGDVTIKGNTMISTTKCIQVYNDSTIYIDVSDRTKEETTILSFACSSKPDLNVEIVGNVQGCKPDYDLTSRGLELIFEVCETKEVDVVLLVVLFIIGTIALIGIILVVIYVSPLKDMIFVNRTEQYNGNIEEELNAIDSSNIEQTLV